MPRWSHASSDSIIIRILYNSMVFSRLFHIARHWLNCSKHVPVHQRDWYACVGWELILNYTVFFLYSQFTRIRIARQCFPSLHCHFHYELAACLLSSVYPLLCPCNSLLDSPIMRFCYPQWAGRSYSATPEKAVTDTHLFQQSDCLFSFHLFPHTPPSLTPSTAELDVLHRGGQMNVLMDIQDGWMWRMGHDLVDTLLEVDAAISIEWLVVYNNMCPLILSFSVKCPLCFPSDGNTVEFSRHQPATWFVCNNQGIIRRI